MQIKLEYADLVVGSKTGAGVQADVNWHNIDRCFDPVLVLEGDKGYAEYLGPRMWLRILNHGDEWHDAANWAQHTVDEISQVYEFGVRKVQFLNEPNLESEGAVGYEDYQEGNETKRRATVETYAFLERWGLEYFSRVRALLAQAGMADVLLCGPAMSPGHNESDGFGGYTYMPHFLQACDILVVHSYWHRDRATFLGGSAAQWYAGRLELDMAVWRGMGIERPIMLGEYNSDGLDFANEVDMALYYEQIQCFNEWLNSKPEVVAQFYFLAYENDTSFYGLSLENMPGAFDALATFDRQSEGEWSLPIWTPPDLPVMDEPIPEPQEEPVPPTIEVQQVRAWSQYIVREAQAQNVPAALVASVMLQESGGDPLAESPMNYSGGVPIGTAKGLMQVMPFHFQPGEDPFDPPTNIRVGVRVLRQGFDRWHSLAQAIAAYFGAIDSQGNITGATDATGMDGNRYVAMALANMALFDDLEGGMTEEQKAAVLGAMDHIWSVAQILRGPRLTRAKQKALAETLENDVATTKQAVGL